MGIDLSEGMLTRAERNLKKMGLDNIDLFQMDAESPEFKDTYFDAITCSFGLFFIPDMPKALASWRRVCRPGGKILFTSFTEQSFSPFGGQFFKDLESFDFSEKAIASQRLKDKDACYELMQNAGLEDIEQKTVQVGYHLRNADEWWAVVWGSAMRGLIGQLSPNDQQIFHQEHLKNISALQVQDGMWMDVEVRINTARVP